jgi:hypothetical protein
MPTIADVGSLFGLTGETLESTTLALAEPSSANIQAVVDAYAVNGQPVPTKLMAYLISENEGRYPADLYRNKLMPWVFLGAGLAALFYLSRKRG